MKLVYVNIIVILIKGRHTRVTGVTGQDFGDLTW